MKILYIDDNRLLVDSVKKLLKSMYIVDFACTGKQGIEQATGTQYNAILLDLKLPDMNGYQVCCELRKRSIKTPILIITAQQSPALSVRLLESGADDFITKPFDNDVLKARIGALLRRGQYTSSDMVIQLGDLTLNLTLRTVTRAGVTIELRRKEFDILEYLVINKGRKLSREMILNHAWESGANGWNNTVDVHIKHLRDKIDRPFGKALIKTAHGIGYTIDDA